MPPLNVASPWYFGRLVMFRSMFGATTLHGRLVVLVRELAARRAEVLQRRREPAGPGRRADRCLENLGKLWPPGHFSTSICQSVSSTDVMMNSGRAASAVDQSSETDRRLAVKNGRSPACRPSIATSSSEHAAAEQVDGQPADVDGPVDPP